MGDLSMTTPLDITQALQDQFGEAVSALEPFRGQLTFVVAAENLLAVAQYLRDTPSLAFKQLSDISGIDYYPQTEPGRFALNYQLLSHSRAQRIRLKVYWNEEDAPVPSVTGLWPSANWEEREAYDMFGILFDGHPDLRRILMPDDWQGYPQRKDYPLGYETVQFSFNFDEVGKHKPYARE